MIRRRMNFIPLARSRTMAEFERYCASDVARWAQEFDEALLVEHGSETDWTFRGYSIPAHDFVDFEVDQLVGGEFDGKIYRPNLRERLVCPITRLNNRQRLTASILMDGAEAGFSIYLMERVTPVFTWSEREIDICRVIGSEYLGPQYKSGEIIDGILHQDVSNLSFDSGCLDIIVSNEVMEHVPDPSVAFAECARVLRPGGRLIMTIPFCYGAEVSVTRAKIINGKIEHLHPPVYHGNPVDENGSLVFTDYGWDVIDLMKASGFQDAWVDVYHDPHNGFLGPGLQVFEAVR